MPPKTIATFDIYGELFLKLNVKIIYGQKTIERQLLSIISYFLKVKIDRDILPTIKILPKVILELRQKGIGC